MFRCISYIWALTIYGQTKENIVVFFRSAFYKLLHRNDHVFTFARHQRRFHFSLAYSR